MTFPESILAASQRADLLTADIRAAHRLACDSSPVAEIILLDLITESCRLEQRLSLLLSAIQPEPATVTP
jgi:hypothetical protein